MITNITTAINIATTIVLVSITITSATIIATISIINTVMVMSLFLFLLNTWIPVRTATLRKSLMSDVAKKMQHHGGSRRTDGLGRWKT